MKHNIDYSTIDLIGRSSELGNHHLKYIYNIEKNFDALVSLIDEKGLMEQVRLLRFSRKPEKTMRFITKYIKDRDTSLDILGCYYSLQFLVMNFKAIDVLKLDLFTSVIDKYNAFSSFISRTGNDFRLLSGAYMEILLNIFLPKDNRPDFMLCSVGTRVDQDDIDIGIIDRGPENRKILTSAFSSLNTQMLKNASTLHYHISEHVGGIGYSASIQEYHNLLDDKIRDFVLINEMLNAVPIFGTNELFTQFNNEILSRYYSHKGKDNKYHEGYLRGLIGEIHDLIMRVPPENTLHPKNDALRMIKAIVFALKTWKGIKQVTSIDTLKILMKCDTPENIEYYNRLYKSLTFFETFKLLYQLFVVQEEEIHLDSIDFSRTLEPVAYTMGYEDNHYAKATTQLLIHYQDHLKMAQSGAKKIVKNITHHLGEITVFYPITHLKPTIETNIEYKGNVARDFINNMRFFSGTRFWDDFLVSLDNPDEKLLNRFLEDLHALPDNTRKKIISKYMKWGKSTPYTIITLMTIIRKHKSHFQEASLINEFLNAFIAGINQTLDDIGRLSKVLIYYPQKMYNFLSLLSEKQLEKLIGILDIPIVNEEVNKTRVKMLAICQLQNKSSYYFKRFLHRVFNSYPDYIISFDNPKKFRQLSEGLYHNIDNFDSIEEKLEKLGRYYDFEFIRLGINTINGTYFGIINREFTIFSDNYIQVLFELCKQEVSKKIGQELVTKDMLAIFAAGGHARSQAFDDDYDLIILLNSEDKHIIDFANQIIVKMNINITRRSIMPHYRFADRFGNYVTTFKELIDFFNNPDEETFIDKSQLLGARMIVGSAHFENEYVEQLITPFIYDKRNEFIMSLLNEISSRYNYHKTVKVLDIKESPGGLRDLENFLFILKAHLIIRDSVSIKLFALLSRRLPEFEHLFDQIYNDYYFLKHVRDLYHIMISDDDELQKNYLMDIIEPLSKTKEWKIDNISELEIRIANAFENNIRNIEKILTGIGHTFKY